VTLLQRRRQQQLRLDWTFGHAPIVCGLDPRAFPLELAPNPLGRCCCCIGGSCHSAELESAIVKKEPWKKTTFFCFEIFQQCQSTLSMQQQYKPFIANINL
jgi:hypothetical protein